VLIELALALCLQHRLVATLPFMICRLWRGWTTNQNADAYECIVREQVIPGIEARRIPGFRAIDLVRRERERDVEFMTLMWFDSLDAAKAFMGDDYQVAHVPPEAQAVLADFDKRSAHYQVLDRRDQPR
jgi:heme-degrading monooxygenase HmoA